jgi:hypothetical protein
MERFTLNQYLRLDMAALQAMNVFPITQNSESLVGGSSGSLYGLLNQCKT